MKNWKFSIIEDREGYKCLIRDGKPSECYKFDVRKCTSRCCAFHYDNETVTLSCMPQPTVYGNVVEDVTEDQVKEYFKSIIKDGATNFYKHYKALGWKINGKIIYDWKSLADMWDNDKYKPKQRKNSTPTRRYDCPVCGDGEWKDKKSCRRCDGRGYILIDNNFVGEVK